MFNIRILAIISAPLVAAMCSGCADSPQKPLPKVTDVDLRIAEETVSFLKEYLSALPENHELVQRYGRFVSLETEPVVRHPAYAASFGPGGSSPCLGLGCRCVFEEFPGYLPVTIFEAKDRSGPGFYLDGFEIVMQPKVEVVTTGVLSDCQPKLIDGELWFVREGGDQVAVRCMIHCWIGHPDFVP